MILFGFPLIYLLLHFLLYIFKTGFLESFLIGGELGEVHIACIPYALIFVENSCQLGYLGFNGAVVKGEAVYR